MARVRHCLVPVVLPLLALGLLPAGGGGLSSAGDTAGSTARHTASAPLLPGAPGVLHAGTADPGFPHGRDEESERGALELSSEGVCDDAGYLCAEVHRFGSLRVLRFPRARRELRVRVPRPAHELPERAHVLQASAILGIEAWDGHPFSIRVLDEGSSEEADLTVRWEAQLSDGGLGETQSRFSMQEGVARYEVAYLALATRSPYQKERALDPHSVELTAAHEMGHALGLPHSDDRDDLMYPTDAATRLSERDFRSVHALYEIPNGATIVR